MTTVLFYSEALEAATLHEFAAELKRAKIECQLFPIANSGPMAGIEAYLPTAIGLWLTAEYFAPMVNDLGKDHYTALKQAFSKLFVKADSISVSKLGSAGKVNVDNPYSMILSIEAQTEGRAKFKLLLPIGAEESEIGCAVDIFASFMRRFHSNQLSKQEKELVKSARVIGGCVITVANVEKRILEFPDPLKSSTI